MSSIGLFCLAVLVLNVVAYLSGWSRYAKFPELTFSNVMRFYVAMAPAVILAYYLMGVEFDAQSERVAAAQAEKWQKMEAEKALK